jgi:hypothetical protein
MKFILLFVLSTYAIEFKVQTIIKNNKAEGILVKIEAGQILTTGYDSIQPLINLYQMEIFIPAFSEKTLVLTAMYANNNFHPPLPNTRVFITPHRVLTTNQNNIWNQTNTISDSILQKQLNQILEDL